MNKSTILLFLFAISIENIISSTNQRLKKSEEINVDHQKNNPDDNMYYQWPGPSSPVSTYELEEQEDKLEEQESQKSSNFIEHP